MVKIESQCRWAEERKWEDIKKGARTGSHPYNIMPLIFTQANFPERSRRQQPGSRVTLFNPPGDFSMSPSAFRQITTGIRKTPRYWAGIDHLGYIRLKLKVTCTALMKNSLTYTWLLRSGLIYYHSTQSNSRKFSCPFHATNLLNAGFTRTGFTNIILFPGLLK